MFPIPLDRRMSLSSRQVLVAIMTATLAVWPVGAQSRLIPDAPDFRATSRLVLVPVIVVDRRGALVVGLKADAFTLTQDGVSQQIRTFSEEDAPVSLGLVLDMSSSMKSFLGPAKEALRALMSAANPADEAFLNAVSSRPMRYSGFTRDFDRMLGQLTFEKAAGSTALVDTIRDSFKQLRSGVHARKALLVVSDGMDNHSRCSIGELLNIARESDAQVYTIAVGNMPPLSSKALEMMEEKRGLHFLRELATETGGLSFVVSNRAEIEAGVASIGHALRNQYTLGYAPFGRDGGKWHKIKVKVASSKMRVYARPGYHLE